jgi:hypothetical protein
LPSAILPRRNAGHALEGAQEIGGVTVAQPQPDFIDGESVVERPEISDKPCCSFGAAPRLDPAVTIARGGSR